MKAAQISRYGGPEVITLSDVVNPVPSEGQVLIEVHAAGLNPFDYKLRRGYMEKMIPLTFPVTLGGDVAGVITQLGSGVEGFAIGDAVYGQAQAIGGASGACAQFATAKTTSLAHKPTRIDFIHAAALPLVGASAVQALEEHIRITKGQKIFIHGGSGGIGSFAVQLAKFHGAYVAVSASAAHTEFVKSLGADSVIDYKTQQFEAVLKDFDAVFDMVGGEDTNKALHILKKGGILVSMSGQPDPELAGKLGVTAIGQMTKTTTERLVRVAQLVDEGHIKVEIDTIFPLEQVQQAFTHLETEHPKGKVVLQIKK